MYTPMKRLVSAVTAVTTVGSMLLTVVPVHAAALTTVSLFPSRVQAGVTTGVTYSVAFTPTTSTTGGAAGNSVVLVFPASDTTDYCRTGGALTITAFTNDFTGSAPIGLPGTETATCVQGGTNDYIEIENIDNMTGGTKYGFTVSGDTGVLGTGDTAATDIQYRVCTKSAEDMVETCTGADDSSYGAFDLSVDDTVSVTATVNATFSFALSTTTCALGTLTTSQVDACSITLTTSTNAQDGYVTTVRDETNGLDDGLGNDVNDVADAAVTAGSEEYGISTEDASVDIAEFTDNGGDIDGTSCTTNLAGPLAAFSALTTTNQSVVETAAPVANEATDVCIAAAISGTTAAGVYTDEVTFVSTGYF